MKIFTVVAIAILFISSGFLLTDKDSELDQRLISLLNENKFDGRIQQELEKRLGRKLNTAKINLGKLVFFDKGLQLHQDNSCAGCHAPNFGFGDSQPIAIGIQNNDTVGAHRTGPRNQRRTPTVINTAFYPALMWNGRFNSVKDDPFDNGDGFEFPPPEDAIFNKEAPYLQKINHLLVAQAHIPFTEQTEAAGFTTKDGKTFASFSRFSGLTKDRAFKNADGKSINGKATPMVFFPNNGAKINGLSGCGVIDFSIFDDGKGLNVPPPDPEINSPNFRIRDKVLRILNSNAEYRKLFGEIYPKVKNGALIDFLMVGEVVAEFEFSLTFSRSPLDEYAMGNTSALNESQKRGAIIFFSKGKCATCHATADESNQMFSDFKMHNAGVPQIHPTFGIGTGNVPFSSLECAKTETGTLDFGTEEFTGEISDRYKFRSSPLRNIKMQPFFFHNGSFNSLKDAVTFHLNPSKNISSYAPSKYGVPNDLSYRSSDMADVMRTLDPVLKQGIILSAKEIDDLVAFLADGLYDKRITTAFLEEVIPASVPSGKKLQYFEFADTDEATIAQNAERKKIMTRSQFNVYPNPVTDVLYVEVANNIKIEKIEIIDAAGRVRIVQRLNADQRSAAINVQALQQGIYFLRITDRAGTITSEIINKK
jgi:cytochrome c peroxidase